MPTAFIRAVMAAPAIVCVAATSALPLEQGEAQRVFESVSPSVVLVEMLAQDGAVMAHGTAFLVGPRRLITNAHVVTSGRCHLRLGSARVACTVVKRSSRHDLALLSVDSDFIARPLDLVRVAPKVGSSVYVVSNPLGLERSISAGLFSGVRTIDGAELMQLTAPVSPGSSGGPVVTSAAEVVGVVVGSYRSGQLLNFAVPADVLRSFMSATDAPDTVTSLLARLEELESEQSALASSEDAAWKRNQAEYLAVLERAGKVARSGGDLLKLSTKAEWRDNGLAVSLARRALAADPGLHEAALYLAQLLVWTAPDDGDPRRAFVLTEALSLAQRAIKGAGQRENTLYVLAQVYDAKDQALDAYAALRTASTMPAGESHLVLSLLIRVTVELGRTTEATGWLDRLLAPASKPEVITLSLLADSLERRDAHRLAARIYDYMAANVAGQHWRWCSAAAAWYVGGDGNEALSSGRACIRDVQPDEQQRLRLSTAHYVLASILLDRGVDDDGLIHARKAAELHPTSTRAFAVLSNALGKNRRYLEAIDAARTAIRLSDGANGRAHFALGLALFELDRIDEARQAFEQAARVDPKDAAAAFNVGLCAQRQGMRLDAIQWFEQVLKRSPPQDVRERTERALKGLGAR